MQVSSLDYSIIEGHVITNYLRTSKLTQLLLALVALIQDPDSSLSTHVAAHNSLQLQFQVRMPSSGLHQYQTPVRLYTLIYMQANTQTFFLI